MAGMAEGTAVRTAYERTALTLIWASTFLLWTFHLISHSFFVGVCFLVLLPLTTIKAFLDYRRRGL